MGDKQFSLHETIAAKDNLWVRVIDRVTGRDRKVASEDLADYIIDKVPPPPEIHDYDEITNPSNITDDKWFVTENGDESGYNKIPFIVLKRAITQYIYPVGQILHRYDSTSPSTLYPGTTWTQIAQGRVLIGQGQGTDVNGTPVNFLAGTSGGEYEHQLTIPELPSHSHSLQGWSNGDDAAGTFPETGDGDGTGSYSATTSTGSSLPHNNMQPYLTVYIWRRVA